MLLDLLLGTGINKCRLVRIFLSKFTKSVHQVKSRWTFRGQNAMVDTSNNIKSPVLCGTFDLKIDKFHYNIIIPYFFYFASLIFTHNHFSLYFACITYQAKHLLSLQSALKYLLSFVNGGHLEDRQNFQKCPPQIFIKKIMVISFKLMELKNKV